MDQATADTHSQTSRRFKPNQKNSMTTHQNDTAWYLLQCKRQQENRAEEQLGNQGYTCFLPRLREERIRRGCRHTETVPLFPGYMFIQLNTQSDNWGPIRSTRGVNRLVGFGGQPLSVPDNIVDVLKTRVALEPKVHALQTGDRVRITEGAFTGVEAIFNTYDGESRVILLLNILQSEQRVSLPLHCIAK